MRTAVGVDDGVHDPRGDEEGHDDREPDPAARTVWRAEPGVVGRISDCASGWCSFEVDGKRGYIETAHLWGVGPDEVVR